MIFPSIPRAPLTVMNMLVGVLVQARPFLFIDEP
jgi:hypothetical protein